MAIISGVGAGGGGDVVTATDTCARVGPNIPPFTTETKGKLNELLAQPGIITYHPLDLGGAGRSLKHLEKSLDLVLGCISR